MVSCAEFEFPIARPQTIVVLRPQLRLLPSSLLFSGDYEMLLTNRGFKRPPNLICAVKQLRQTRKGRLANYCANFLSRSISEAPRWHQLQPKNSNVRDPDLSFKIQYPIGFFTTRPVHRPQTAHAPIGKILNRRCETFPASRISFSKKCLVWACSLVRGKNTFPDEDKSVNSLPATRPHSLLQANNFRESFL
jgi:hypothetical protein